MTKAEASAELDRLKTLFRLQDWETPLKTRRGAELPSGNGAEILQARPAKVALVRVALGCRDEEAKRRLLHETLHLALADLADALDPFLGSLPKKLRGVAEKAQIIAEEQVVVRLERAFVEATK